MGNETFCNFSALYMRGAGSAFRKGGTFEKHKVGYVEGKKKMTDLPFNATIHKK